MRGVIAAIALALAVPAFGQGAGGYTAADNPFQGEYAFTSGTQVPLKVRVMAVEFDAMTLSMSASGGEASCLVALEGTNQSDRKVTLTGVLLLEDANGQALERLTMTRFRVKPGRPFTRRETLQLRAGSAEAAAKAFVFLRVE